MEHVVELQTKETVSWEGVRLGFLGWGPFGQGLQKHLHQLSHPLSTQGFVYPLESDTPEVSPWKVVWDVDSLFQRANFIWVEASWPQLEFVLPRIRLLISDAHVLVLLGGDLSLARLLPQINERKLIRCLYSRVRRFADSSIAFVSTDLVTAEENERFQAILEGVPVLLPVASEAQLDALHGVISNGPAIGYTFIDAIADGVMKLGIPRAQGLLLAAHALFGASRTYLETETHPGILRDRSIDIPGIPLSGVLTLEQQGLRGLLIQAMEAAASEASDQTTSSKK